MMQEETYAVKLVPVVQGIQKAEESILLQEGQHTLGRRNFTHIKDKKISRHHFHLTVQKKRSTFIVELVRKSVNPMFLTKQDKEVPELIQIGTEYSLECGDKISLVGHNYVFSSLHLESKTRNTQKKI